jgi:hypothetical protein
MQAIQDEAEAKGYHGYVPDDDTDYTFLGGGKTTKGRKR